VGILGGTLREAGVPDRQKDRESDQPTVKSFREYFNARVYFRNWGQALLVGACGIGLMFLSKVFGGAVVMWLGLIVTFVGMALIPSMGYRDGVDIMGDRDGGAITSADKKKDRSSGR